MCNDNSCIWLILLILIFFNCNCGGNGNSVAPLNFDTFFDVSGSGL